MRQCEGNHQQEKMAHHSDMTKTSKINVRTRNRLKAAERPTATFNKLEEHLIGTDYSLNETAIFYILYMS